MVYFIYNPLRKGYDAIYECEIFWNENERKEDDGEARWNLDVHTNFIPAELLKEYRNGNISNLDDEKFDELLKDMEKVTDFRLWLWEYSGLNNKRYVLNTPESGTAHDKLVHYCEDAIDKFAEKYGYQVKVD